MLAVINGGMNIRRQKCRIPSRVPAAERKYICVAATEKNTVPMPVILKLVIRVVAAMNNRSNIQAYHSAMAQVKAMLKRGIIEENDIVSIEDKLARKYGLKFGSIYRENDLINLSFRANISHTQEVI
jgi:hypothetical protein